MQITESISDRAIDITVANFEHLATTGVGLAIAWLGARQGSILGALITVSGLVIVVRGVTGIARSIGRRRNQGEGDRIAARRYNHNVREFIDDGRVAPAAVEAAATLI